MERRNFLKGLGAGMVGAAAATGMGPLARVSRAEKKHNIGEIKSLKVTCLSETSWFDSPRMLQDIKDAGGGMVSHYEVPWTQENIGGYAALIEFEQLNGTKRKILMDTGWNQAWTDYVFEKSGVDKMLENKEIEMLVVTHEHMDHLWGLPCTLKRYQNIPMIIPSTFYPEGKAFLAAKYKNDASKCYNDIPHTGKLVELGPNDVLNPYPGVALKMFDVPILLRVKGEVIFYFNVKDKGIVTVTGCCHPGILSLLSWAKRNIEGCKPYGCYGGLHIAVFENWDPKFNDIINGVKAFKLKKLACNHCTGWIWAQKAREAGVPIVCGTQKYKEYKKVPTTGKGATDNVYLRNGDVLEF
jgi:7,8-dihydropterin-6-yl-methyl-4-(beta-D-ribofuranosyl)aminobenzene 5'-phosphate synthase